MTSKGSPIEHLVHKAREDSRLLAVMLFGSQARGEGTPRSDVDVCLVLAPPAALAQKSGEAAEVRLHYLATTPEGFDIQVFQLLPLYVRQRVLREGNVLFCRDEDALYELAYRTAKAWEDFRPRYRYYLDQVAHGGS